MKKDELVDNIKNDFIEIDRVIIEIKNVFDKLGDSTPDTIQITALSAFASQFYTGLENILKRISRYLGAELPNSTDWHLVLFKRFCDPPHLNFPVLFDKNLATELNSIRKFRHYFFHGYSFNIEWNWLNSGMRNLEPIYEIVKNSINHYILSLED